MEVHPSSHPSIHPSTYLSSLYMPTCLNRAFQSHPDTQAHGAASWFCGQVGLLLSVENFISPACESFFSWSPSQLSSVTACSCTSRLSPVTLIHVTPTSKYMYLRSHFHLLHLMSVEESPSIAKEKPLYFYSISHAYLYPRGLFFHELSSLSYLLTFLLGG